MPDVGAEGMEGRPPGAAPGPDGPGNGRTARDLGLEIPTKPVEVPAETREEQEAAAAATATKGKTGLT
ncbi:MAG TPA: hypothetical protein VNM37_20385, partial [Candidatus Dormibacteraeota bacterium]|nr:hypothetical protein [Candidatus Dormibacteraeota bacterium]